MFDSFNTQSIQFILLFVISIYMGFVLAGWWVGG